MSTAAPSSASSSPRRPWAPDRADHLIYNWVKMEGKTQAWVSQQLKIDQSTVSRLIQRYERWQAHAREREGGRLDASERLRAQRWLTYERNELLLGSCMRIARDMEGFIDTSKSTISHPLNDCTKENAVSTVHATLDRTGSVCRFLRLAFRINMEQLKLASLDPPPHAAALTDEELDQQDLDIATFTKELAAFGLGLDLLDPRPAESDDPDLSSRHRGTHEVGRCAVPSETPTAPDDLATRVPPGDTPRQGSSLAEPPPIPNHQNASEPIEPATQTTEDQSTEPSTVSPPTWNLEPETCNSALALHNVHNLHNAGTPETTATPNQPCTCDLHIAPEKNSPSTCIIDFDNVADPLSPVPDIDKLCVDSHQTSPQVLETAAVT